MPTKTVSSHVFETNYENYTSDEFFIYIVLFDKNEFLKNDNHRKEINRFVNRLTVFMNICTKEETIPLLIDKEYIINEFYLRSNIKLLIITYFLNYEKHNFNMLKEDFNGDSITYSYFPKEDSYKNGIERLGITFNIFKEL